MGKAKANSRSPGVGQPKPTPTRNLPHGGDSTADYDDTDASHHLLRQKCLNIFRDALQPSSFNAELLQEVKGHLYNRDFATAFSKPEYLAVYAARWSPSRALGYLSILIGLKDSLLSHAGSDATPSDPYSVVCLGGGAGAEVVALAAWRNTWGDTRGDGVLSLKMMDVADWESVATLLSESVIAPSRMSKYATEAAKLTNKAMLDPDYFQSRFVQQDVLTWSDDQVRSQVANADLVTILFTLNELYSSSIAKTQNLFAQLTKFMRPNAFILVVDSPGSYSSVSIGGAEKKYPMRWLLDLALLGPPPKSGTASIPPAWERVESDDSRWFRLSPGLQYPIELENMRYQIHLYRRVGEVP